jgi:hypothetical protein
LSFKGGRKVLIIDIFKQGKTAYQVEVNTIVQRTGAFHLPGGMLAGQDTEGTTSRHSFTHSLFPALTGMPLVDGNQAEAVPRPGLEGLQQAQRRAVNHEEMHRRTVT